MASEYISVTDGNKLIRQALKAVYPDVKFRVHSRHSGTSTTVEWTDGPAEADVKAIASRFEGSTLDSSYDLRTPHRSFLNGREVHFICNYVSTVHHITDALRDKINAVVAQRWGLIQRDPQYWYYFHNAYALESRKRYPQPDTSVAGIPQPV